MKASLTILISLSAITAISYAVDTLKKDPTALTKSIRKLALTLILVISPTTASAVDAYKVNLKRIAKDVYQDTISKQIFITQYCYEYAYGEEAILIWEGEYSYENKIIFDSGTECTLKPQ